VGSASSRLVDWGTAGRVGSGVAGDGPLIRGSDRARLTEDFADAVSKAEKLAANYTRLDPTGPPTRPWVMTRAEWVRQNLRGFDALLEPFAAKTMGSRREGLLTPMRRKVLAAQVGGLLGYLGRKVLGQYDLFLPPDDRDLLYSVGPNVIGVERRFRFPPQEFRLWLSLHEVTHRLQFDGVPWLRSYLMGLANEYLESIELDPRRLIETVRRAREEARRSNEWRGLGFLFLLMTPEQRQTFRRMQALMSLLEGHGNHVMEVLSQDRIRSAPRMRRVLRERRRSEGVGKVVQRAIGIEVKVRQYDRGERFVGEVVDRVGQDGFHLVWAAPENLPSMGEIHQPEAWVQRVAP
jgi:coenzyme F420 biosynthesis associated uncharacterized protein